MKFYKFIQKSESTRHYMSGTWKFVSQKTFNDVSNLIRKEISSAFYLNFGLIRSLLKFFHHLIKEAINVLFICTEIQSINKFRCQELV